MKTRRDRTMSILFMSLVLLIGLPGCASTGSGSSGQGAPAYVRSYENYRHFETAAALSTYLRYASDTGPLVSAHRGGPMPGFPENCIETMDRVLRLAPALMEINVRMTADSVLVLMHDEDLGRTSTGAGAVAEQTFRDIRSVLLRDPAGIITPFRIPTLSEALAWSDGRTVLLLDVKPHLPPARVAEEIRRHRASNRVIVMVYNIPDLMAFGRFAPDLMYSVPAGSPEDLERALDAGIDPSRVIVSTGVGEVRPAVIEAAHAKDIRVMLGTYGEVDERAVAAGTTVYEHLLESGIDVIVTDRVADAARAVARISAFSDP